MICTHTNASHRQVAEFLENGAKCCVESKLKGRELLCLARGISDKVHDGQVGCLGEAVGCLMMSGTSTKRGLQPSKVVSYLVSHYKKLLTPDKKRGFVVVLALAFEERPSPAILNIFRLSGKMSL